MCRLFFMTIAILLILFGISGLWMMPKLIQQKIEQRIQLKIGTKMYERFTKVPIPLTVKFYLFNVTNSEQVLAGLERPHFQEVGPFMYKQWRERDVIDIEDNNRRLRYKERKTFIPMFKRQQQQQESISSTMTTTTRHNSDKKLINNETIIAQEKEKQLLSSSENNYYLDPANFNITIINLPLLSILTKFAQLEEGSLKRNLISRIVSRLIDDGKDKILITKPANEILFDGYKVNFMESARDLISSTLGFNFQSPLPANKFGFFYLKNGTTKDAGELTIFTGRNDSMNDFMLIENWNDLKELNVWPTNTIAGNKCNQIKGTDGSQFHPGVTRDQILAIFSPLVCRSLFIKYKEDVKTKDIPLLRFGTPAELFEAPRKRPENACFCTIPYSSPSPSPSTTDSNSNLNKSYHSSSKISDSRCYLDGLMDLSLCQKGAPIAASSPHFYNADPMLSMAAGLKPSKDLHETFIDIEPMTGSVFRAASRAQLNAFVEKAALDVVDNRIIGNMTPMVAPLMWLEERGEIDDRSSMEFKNQLLNTVFKAKRTFKLAILIGFVLAIVISIQYWYVTCYSIDHLRKKDYNNRSSSSSSSSRGRNRIRKRDHNNDKTSLNSSSLTRTTTSPPPPPTSKTIKILKGKRLRDNIRYSSGARKSNLAAKLDDNLTLTKSLDEDLSGAGPVIALAGILGAVAGPSSSNRKGPGFSGGNNNNLTNEDEDELSKRMLVGDEWEPGVATTSLSNTNSSGRSSNIGADNQAASNEPSQSSIDDHDNQVD